MLFNSFEFLCGFLPITYVVYIGMRRFASGRIAMRALVLASLAFYGWWHPRYLLLIGASIALNFFVAGRIDASGSETVRRRWLQLGVVGNLAGLGYFKYAVFFVKQANVVLGDSIQIPEITLPLAISFFTFQQVAFLVDVHRAGRLTYDFADYALFVTFFPQLIAGPIVHHAEMLPQFTGDSGVRSRDGAVGATIFIFGLFKKVVLADSVARFSSPVFVAADAGVAITCVEAWFGTLAYTLQIYFDFSGYSDMAIGLARLFGIRLPVNFNSPYKARSISDFWRRWHITLSRFLRELSLYSVRRKSARSVPPLCESLPHDASRRDLARGRLDLCRVGRAPRFVLGDQSRDATLLLSWHRRQSASMV